MRGIFIFILTLFLFLLVRNFDVLISDESSTKHAFAYGYVAQTRHARRRYFRTG